ncbi:MAG TPA: nucleotide exchange factor GrpE [Methanocorpusculum sp.]|nr:nucleotide exchange factor GrpE [Methanocorpusculum sp.]
MAKKTETENDSREQTMDAAAEKKIVDEKQEEDALTVLQKKYDELNDKFLRNAAEFENYRKRSAREQENSVRFAKEMFALDFVDVVDNFDRALKHEDEQLRDGLEQIYKLCESVMEKNGIVKMNSKGMQFDPNLHEAVVTIPSDAPAGVILDVAVPGYMIRDKVLRHAKVIVSSPKEE